MKIPLKLPLEISLKMLVLMVGQMMCHEGGQVAKTTGKGPTKHITRINSKMQDIN